MASTFDGSIFGGDAFKLADLDFLGDEAELRARARQELSAADAEGEPPRLQEGADGTDSVRLSIDRAGVVESVRVSGSIAPGKFATALLEAFQAAQAKHINAAALRRFAAQERGERQAEPSTADDFGSPPEGGLDEIWRILAANDNQLYRIERGQGPATRDITSPHGLLTAQLEGTGITDIRGDVERIRTASASQLEVEALALFAAAREEATHGR